LTHGHFDKTTIWGIGLFPLAESKKLANVVSKLNACTYIKSYTDILMSYLVILGTFKFESLDIDTKLTKEKYAYCERKEFIIANKHGYVDLLLACFDYISFEIIDAARTNCDLLIIYSPFLLK
jgi:hypothetical protein